MSSKADLKVNSRISHLHRGIDILQELEILLGKERKTKFGNYIISSRIHMLQDILEEDFDETVSDAKEARNLCRDYKSEIEKLKDARRKTQKKQKDCYRRQLARY